MGQEGEGREGEGRGGRGRGREGEGEGREREGGRERLYCSYNFTNAEIIGMWE